MTPLTYWLDKLKEFALALMIGIPFLYILLMFMTRMGSLWWLWTSLLVIGFQLLMMILYPLVIAPLFNKFSPLEEGDLKNSLEKLAEKCRFAIQGIFVMDGSKRSAHSNAYFTGFSKARRIVLLDTLIQQLSVPELTAVLAHEMGHDKKKHIHKMFLFSSLLTLLGFFMMSLLIDWIPIYQAFGLTKPSIPLAIIIFSLIGGAFTFWLKPFFHALSRRHEYQADAYAAEQTDDDIAMGEALYKLSEKNLTNFTPHPAYSAYYYSHPTLLERITVLQKL